MCTDSNSYSNSMSLTFSGDAPKMLEVQGQSHYHPKASLVTMPYRAVSAGCWRSAHEGCPNQRVEVRPCGLKDGCRANQSSAGKRRNTCSITDTTTTLSMPSLKTN